MESSHLTSYPAFLFFYFIFFLRLLWSLFKDSQTAGLFPKHINVGTG